MPAEDEISEEGVGFFRDVWAIYDIGREEAVRIIADERIAIQALDNAATDAQSFEDLATSLEHRNPDFPDEDDADEVAAMAELARHADVDGIDLSALEVGVAGLTYALAAIGCVPAASCRSHFGRHSWSDRPVVLAAIDRAHADWLQPLVKSASCGFALDDARGEFLVIHAMSIKEMNSLASLIMSESERNPPPPLRLRHSESEPRPSEAPTEVGGQQPLFEYPAPAPQTCRFDDFGK